VSLSVPVCQASDGTFSAVAAAEKDISKRKTSVSRVMQKSIVLCRKFSNTKSA
jgi:hypothetical protein